MFRRISPAQDPPGFTKPRPSTGRYVTSYPMLSSSFAAFKTAGCSTDEVIICFLRERFAAPKSAILSLSVPPDVKIIRPFPAPSPSSMFFCASCKRFFHLHGGGCRQTTHYNKALLNIFQTSQELHRIFLLSRRCRNRFPHSFYSLMFLGLYWCISFISCSFVASNVTRALCSFTATKRKNTFASRLSTALYCLTSFIEAYLA